MKIIFTLLLLQLYLIPCFSDIIVLRHGEGTHNIERVFNSNPDHPNYKPANLTEKGVRQTMKLAENLFRKGYTSSNITRIYVSPLPRTKQTAHLLVAAGLIAEKNMIIEPRLIEIQMGEREGLYYSEFPDEDPWDHSNAKERYNGEEFEEVDARVLSVYREALNENVSGHTLFVTHRTPAKQLLSRVKGKDHMLQTAEAEIIPVKFESATAATDF